VCVCVCVCVYKRVFLGDFNAREEHALGILEVAHRAVFALIVLIFFRVNSFQEPG
jgi:hypothetical protein